MRKNSTKPTLLVVGAPDVVARALRHVFTLFDFDITALAFDAKAASSVIQEFGEGKFHLPVIAGSVGAWEMLRTANLWSRTNLFVRRYAELKNVPLPVKAELKQTDSPRHGRNVTSPMPVVVPAVALDSVSPYDEIVAGGVGVTNLIPWVLANYALSKSFHRHHLGIATLRLLKEDYHQIRPQRVFPGDHREADFHAALRILHGGALSGWIAPNEWLSASNEVLKAAETPTKWSKKSNFYEAITRWICPGATSLENFAFLLVLDDEDFWRESLTPLWEKYGVRLPRIDGHRIGSTMNA